MPPLKYLGEGYYYKVYEHDAERVSKKLQPYWFSLRKIYALERERGGASFLQAIRGAHASVAAGRKVLWNMKGRMAHMPSAFFANPVFRGRTLDYIQDRVVVVDDYLANHSPEQNKQIIDGYLELQQRLWPYGLHDKTYKLQQNYGVDERGSVVCIDFGEFAFTKEAALKSIGKKKWLTRRSYRDWSDTDLRNYYTQRMAEVMTEERLAAAWPPAVIY